MTREFLENIFREVFENEALVLRGDLSAKDVDGWDSFNHINLIVMLEESYKITFETEEIASMANVGDLITILRTKGIDVSL